MWRADGGVNICKVVIVALRTGEGNRMDAPLELRRGSKILEFTGKPLSCFFEHLNLQALRISHRNPARGDR